MYAGHASPPKSEGHSERAIGPNPEAEPRLPPPRAPQKVRVPITLRTQLMSQPGLAAHSLAGLSRWSVIGCVGMEQFERLRTKRFALAAPAPALGAFWL